MRDWSAPTNSSADWTRVDATSDPSFYIGMLDATRADALERAARDPARTFAPLQLRPGLKILDVGCGTGAYLRLLSPLVAPGRAVGVDLSETLLAEARTRDDGADPNLSFRTGDARALPFPDASFDRVTANQVLLHLEDSWPAVAEMRRVLSATGILSIEEWDWNSICLATTDRDLGRQFTHLLCDQMRNALIVRELDWRLRQLGFGRVELLPEVRISRHIDAAFMWLLEPVTRKLVRTGRLRPDQGDDLLSDLTERSQQDRYFLARIYYRVIAMVDPQG